MAQAGFAALRKTGRRGLFVSSIRDGEWDDRILVSFSSGLGEVFTDLPWEESGRGHITPGTCILHNVAARSGSLAILTLGTKHHLGRGLSIRPSTRYFL